VTRSILHRKDGTCYLCVRLGGDYRIHRQLEKHHVFPGKNRMVSDRNGLIVWLCHEHHRSSAAAVHVCHGNMLIIQQDAQREYEKTHTRQQWMELIGKNYLEEDEQDSIERL